MPRLLLLKQPSADIGSETDVASVGMCRGGRRSIDKVVEVEVRILLGMSEV